MNDRAHWDERYQRIGAEDVSWYEEHPDVSLELLQRLGIGTQDSLIDVGGGASLLVDHLLEAGYHDLAVLDLSSVALETARSRLGDPPEVTWIPEDLATWQPTRRWDVWHDRAVLHFLMSDEARAAYVSLMHRALEPGGAFVIGTFAQDGPTECSALPVRRNRPEELAELLGDVDVVVQQRRIHRTPSGNDQPFNWIAGRIRTQAQEVVA